MSDGSMPLLLVKLRCEDPIVQVSKDQINKPVNEP